MLAIILFVYVAIGAYIGCRLIKADNETGEITECIRDDLDGRIPEDKLWVAQFVVCIEVLLMWPLLLFLGWIGLNNSTH